MSAFEEKKRTGRIRKMAVVKRERTERKLINIKATRQEKRWSYVDDNNVGAMS